MTTPTDTLPTLRTQAEEARARVADMRARIVAFQIELAHLEREAVLADAAVAARERREWAPRTGTYQPEIADTPNTRRKLFAQFGRK